MLWEYVCCYNVLGSFVYFYFVFEEYLGEMYGIMVYQEDVLNIVYYFGGFSFVDVDMFRCVMMGKKVLF